MRKFKYLSTQINGRVLTLRLNNPPLNFLTSAMIVELGQLFDEIETRTDIGAVIITGALPDVFLTHFDVSEIKAAADSMSVALSPTATNLAVRAESALDHLPGARHLITRSPAAGLAQVNMFHETCARMRSMDKVFIAALNGRAMGGGLELALACDLRIMIEGSVEGGQVIGMPEIYIGLIPGGGGTQMLARMLGQARALAMCLDGTLLSPQEALALGLITKVVPPEQLMVEAEELAQRMARRSASAVRSLKRVIYDGGSQPLKDGLALEKAEFLSTATQADTRRAMLAYAEFITQLSAKGGLPSIADFHEWVAGTAVTFND